MIRGNSGKMAIIIVIVVLLVVCSVLGVAVFTKKGHAKKSKIPDGPKTMVSMGEMVVNLADSAEVRYVKADIVLEVCGKMEAGGEGGEGGGDSTGKAPLRDAIIGVLSSKQFAQINKPGGKDALKDEITTACNKRLGEAKVTNVYFNQFAMQ